MASAIKEKSVADLKEDLKGSTQVVVTHYQGLTAEELNGVRSAIRPFGGKYKVVKNRLAKIAFDSTGFGQLREHLKGPVAIAYKATDVAGMTKALFKFSDEHPNFKVKMGFLFGGTVDPASLKTIANLPSREVLLSTLLATLNSPLQRLAATMNEPLQKLHRSLAAVAKKRETLAA